MYEAERNIVGQIKQSKVSEEDALKEAEEMLKKLEEQKNKESKPKEEEAKEQKNSKIEKQKDKGVEEQETEDTKSVKSVEEKTKTKSVIKKRPARSVKTKIRGKKYQEKFVLVDRSKFYAYAEALDLVKKTSYSKFDASVEMHIRLVPAKNKKAKQELRGILQMPHPIGKEPKVGVIDETMVEKILKEKKTEFDILLTTPEMMPKIARVAKILGPKGKMPNPKTGTITNDPEKTIKEIKSGRIEYKTDDTGNVHQMIGKVSFDNKNLEENYQAILAAIGVNKIQSVTLSATMGPGVKVRV